MKKVIPWILVVLLSVWIVYLYARKSAAVTKTVTTTKVVRDTVKETIPLYVSQIIVRHDTIKVSKIKNDTIPYIKDSVIVIPIESKTYQNDNYKANVSGYDTKLDSLTLYNKNTVKTVTITKSRSRWNLGVSAGYGISKTGLSPYIGVGVVYNLLR